MEHQQRHNFLHFTRKEKHGILFLLLLISLLNVAPGLYRQLFPQELKSDETFLHDLARLKAIPGDSIKWQYRDEARGVKPFAGESEKTFSEKRVIATLFPFDPNKLPVAGWQQLGVHEKLAQTIQKYLAKGGRFNHPDDLRKIWGMPASLADRLIPWVRLPDKTSTSAKEFSRNNIFQKKPISVINLNSADSAALDALPGIGGGFAKRILKFRERLGGFVSVDQVAETFGLPDSVYRKIRPFLQVTDGKIRKIDINEASSEELKSHPYIRYQIANAIVEYRAQHGQFGSIDELKKIMIITDEIYQKLSPYLSL